MSDPVRDLQDSFARNYTLATAPTDHMLLEQAKATAGHISLMAVSEEYDRLILAKYHRPRGFLSRLFGSWFSIAAGRPLTTRFISGSFFQTDQSQLLTLGTKTEQCSSYVPILRRRAC